MSVGTAVGNIPWTRLVTAFLTSDDNTEEIDLLGNRLPEPEWSRAGEESKALRHRGISHYIIESSSGQGRPFLDHVQGGLIKEELKRSLQGRLAAGSQGHPESQGQGSKNALGHRTL